MIDNSTLEKLEFPKILNYISHYAITDPGKSIILSLKPSTDIRSVLRQGNINGYTSTGLSFSGHDILSIFQRDTDF